MNLQLTRRAMAILGPELTQAVTNNTQKLGDLKLPNMSAKLPEKPITKRKFFIKRDPSSVKHAKAS